MIIEKLTLEKVGPFKSFDIDFKENVSILIGDNGVGKSTIVSSIVCIWQNSVNRDIFPSTNNGEEESLIAALFYPNFQRSIHYTKEPSSNNIKINSQNFRHSVEYPIVPCNPYRRFAKTNIQGPIKENPTSDKEGLKTQFSNKFALGEDSTIQAWIVNRYFFRNEKWGARYRREMNYFRKCVKQFFSDDYKVEYHTVDELMVPIFKTPFGLTPFHNLSSGIQSIFFLIYNIISNLSQYYDKSENIFLEKGLVIVDEIETHLHPKWQQRIVEGLVSFFPNCQFIITTHSPLVVSSAGENQVIMLKPIDGNLESKYIQNTKGWLAEDIYSELMALESSRDVEVDRKIEELEKLFLKRFESNLSKVEKSKFTKLRNELVQSLPSNDPIITLMHLKALEENIKKGK